MPAAHVRFARFADLTTTELYALLRLRVDVFVVEQACPYPDLDGRDTEPGTEHGWVEEDGEVVAALRVLTEDDGDDGDDGVAIGRVVTRADRRGHGHAGRLLAAALARVRERGAGAVRLGAQAHLEEWYGGFGFVRCGPDYLEDGIPHLPMALERSDSLAG